MRKKILKIMGIMLVMLTGCFCGLSGCKDKYRNMKLELSEKEIVLSLDKDDEENFVNRTAEFTAKVSGIDFDEISADVFYDISTPDVISLTRTNANENGVSKFVVTANHISTEPVIVTIRTKEGDKTASLTVTVKKSLQSIQASTTYSPFVVVGEDGTDLSATNAVIFTPEDTSEKQIKFSISKANGHTATISENGHLVVTRKNGVQPVMVKIESKTANVDPIEIPVKVVEPIQAEDIKVMLEENVIENTYKWSVMDLDNSDLELSLNLENTLEECVISEETKIVAYPTNQNILSLDCDKNKVIANGTKLTLHTQGTTGKNTLHLVVKLKDYDYKVEKDIEIEVAKLPNQILINNENLTNRSKAYDIYDKYQNNLGKKFTIEIGDESANDKRYKIRLSNIYTLLPEQDKQELIQSVQILFEDGSEVQLDKPIYSYTNNIYFSALRTNVQVAFDIVPVASEDTNNIYATIYLNLYRGVKENGIVVEKNAINLELNDQLETYEMQFEIDSNEYSNEFVLSLSNENIVRLPENVLDYYDGVLEAQTRTFTFNVIPLREGVTTLMIKANNNEQTEIEIRVVKTVSEIAITTDSPVKNKNVADNGDEMYKLTELSNQKTLNRIVISNKTKNLQFNVIKFYEDKDGNYKQTNAQIISQRVEILENERVVNISIHDQNPYGFITALNTGLTKIRVTVTAYAKNDDIQEFTSEFEIFVYVPIERVSLSNRFIELTDTSTMLYYSEYLEKTLYASIYPSDATTRYVSQNGTENDFYTVSWNQNNYDSLQCSADSSDPNKLSIKGIQLVGAINSRTTIVTATLVQFSRVFTMRCEVMLKRPVLTTSIENIALEITNANGRKTQRNVGINPDADIYLDARDDLYNSKFELLSTIAPSNVTFDDLMYLYLPNYYDFENENYKISPLISLNDSLFKVNRVGTGYVLIVSKDSLSKYSYSLQNGLYEQLLEVYETSNADNLEKNINEFLRNDAYLTCKLLSIKIADGSSEMLSLHIDSLNEFLEINSESALSKFYLLTNDIDCSKIQNFEAIGTVNNVGFSGGFDGNGHTIKNLRYNFSDKTIVSQDNYYFGLFSKLQQKGVIKNLNVTISEVYIEIKNGNSSNLYIGGVVAVNNGTIKNCTTTIAGTDITANAKNMYLGMISSVNYGIVENSSVSGNIELFRNGGELTAVGGLVGYNLGTVKGDFELFTSDQNSVLSQDIKYNSNINISINTLYQMGVNAYGGIVGLNNAVVKNMASNAVIKGNSANYSNYPSNVGGVVGYSRTNANGESILSQLLSTAKVEGYENIGGVVGNINNAKLDHCYNLFLYDAELKNETENFVKISGVNNVGGLIGFTSGGSEISFGMVRSYINQAMFSEYQGDIKLFTDTDSQIGGLVGSINNSIVTSSFAHLNILTLIEPNSQKIGGLASFVDANSSIANCYSITNIDNFVLNLNGTASDYYFNDDETNVIPANWKAKTSEYNNGKYVISDNNRYFILQEPDSIELSFDSNKIFVSNQNKITSGNHFEIDSKNAIVYYYGNNKDKNSIYIQDLISTLILPNSASKLTQFVVIQGQNIANIKNGVLYISGTGLVKIKCISKLNILANDVVTINVIDALNNIDIYDDIAAQTSVSQIELTKGELKQIYFGNDCLKDVLFDVIVNNNDGNYVSLNGKYINQKLTSHDSLVLKGEDITNDVNLTFKPYMIIDNNIYYFGIEKTITVKVVYGIDDMIFGYNASQTTQQDSFEMSIDVIADAEVELSVIMNENDIKVYDINGNSVSNISCIVDGNYISLLKDNSVIEKISYIKTLTKVDTNSYNFGIILDDAPQYYTIEIGIDFTATLGLKSVTKKFTASFKPQAVASIGADFYSYAELNADEITYNVNEVPGDTILAGRMGLLKIDLFPAKAKIDSVEISYDNFNSTVYLRQMILLKGENDIQNSYITYDNASPRINNGIYFDKSYGNIKSFTTQANKNNKDAYEFDGYLYVYVLIPSSANLASILTLNIKVTSSNGEVMTKNKILTVDLPSEIDITFNGQYQAIVADGCEYQIDVVTTKLFNSVNDAQNLEILIDGVVITEGIELLNTIMISSGIYKTTYNITINSTIGRKIELSAKYAKLVNNQFQTYTSKKPLKVFIAKYTVDGFEIENSKNGVFENITGESYDLKVKLLVTAKNIEDYQDEIDALTKAINTKVSTWYAYKLYQENIDGNIYRYMPIDEDYVYEYFKFEKKADNFIIIPTRESETEVMYAIFGIIYSDGNPTCLIGGNGYNDNISLFEHYNKEMDFTNKIVYFNNRVQIKFVYNNTSETPNPIENTSQFLEMNAEKSYRLINDLVFDEPFKPMDIKLGFLDGNGFTITLNRGFDLSDYDNTSEMNVGLFSQVYESMQLHNIKLIIKNSYTDEYGDSHEVLIDLTKIDDNTQNNATTINFGFIAGKNNGVIYNCMVQTNNVEEKPLLNVVSRIMNDVQTYIGGIAGENNGSISNSQSYAAISVNRGYLGGLCGRNKGNITSSFVKAKDVETLLKNTLTTEVGGLTAGFVAVNESEGKIKLSYVEGSRNGDEKFRFSNGKISATSDVAGFVNQNNGLIENCYSNIKIETSKHSSGFVFENTGTIDKCYSASLVEVNSPVKTVFMGTNAREEMNSTNKNITNCFYFDDDTNLQVAHNELAQPFNENEIQKLKDVFEFCDENTENGAWTMKYKKIIFSNVEQEDGIENRIDEKHNFGYIYNTVPVETDLPTLIDANLISNPHVSIQSITNENDNSLDNIYNWFEDELGTVYNPITIASATEYNKKIAYINESKELSNLDKYFRIINDIEFGTELKPETIDKTFKGTIIGNGYTLSKISISADSTHVEEIEENIDKNYGLFAQIKNATIKDLNLKVEYLSANQIENVGTLAGKITDSDITNIVIDAENVVIQGKNFVGGLAGVICGNSNVRNITSNASVNVGQLVTNGLAEIYSHYSQSSRIEAYGYGGSIAGMIEGNNPSEKAVIARVNVQKGVYVIAMHGGFAFGLVGENATVSNTTVKVDSEQFIRAKATAGGIAAENRGKIEKSYIESDARNRDDKVFAGTPKVIGGVVGFNYGGEIIACYSKVDVINNLSTVAGGIVGTTVGGTISYSYATNTVKSGFVYGGLVGSSLKESNLIAKLSGEDESMIDTNQKLYKSYTYRYEQNSVDTTSKFEISNCLALYAWTLDEIQDKNEQPFGLIIGAVDLNNTSNESDESTDVNYFLKISFTTKDATISFEKPVGLISSTPNGTGTLAGLENVKNVESSNKIGTRDFIPSYVTTASGYYKDIFRSEETEWNTYYDISLISRSNPYPTLR